MEFAQLEAYAGRFYGGRPLLITPYAYTVTFSSLAPAATASQVINVAANADFIVTEFHSRSNVSVTAQTISNMTAPFVRVLVTDSGSNEQFTQSAVDLITYTTVGNFANELPYPRIVSGRSTLTVQLSNYSASETYNIDFVAMGVLVRAYSN
jgi:hypothetical protein